MKKILAISLLAVSAASFADFTEGFDDINTLAGSGWAMQNNSTPVGLTGWFQGNPTVFAAQSGPDTSYIGANFNNVAGNATISNWLITPEIDLIDGSTFTFWTRSSGAATWADRLQVRASTAGASTNVGATSTSVGDFSNLLLDINPTLNPAGYPGDWTEFTVNISGLGNASGRLAFRYFVDNGGPSGTNSDFIGIDTVAYEAVPEPATMAVLAGLGLAALRKRRK